MALRQKHFILRQWLLWNTSLWEWRGRGAPVVQPRLYNAVVQPAVKCKRAFKLLSAAGSAAVLFNGIKEARKILFLVLTVIREIVTLLAIVHLEIAKKQRFCCRQR